jgi:cell division protease FtsH
VANKNSWVPFAVIFMLIFVLFKIFFFANDNVPVLITTEQLAELIEKNQVQKVIFYSGTNEVVVQVKSEAGKDLRQAQRIIVQVVNEANLEEVRQMVKNKVEYSVVKPSNPGGWLAALSNIFSIVFPLILIWYFIMMIFRAQSGRSAGTMDDFQKSKVKFYNANAGAKKTFADIAGCEEAKEELKEVVDFLRNPNQFVGLGARMPKGVILVGDPGTGKTALARAVAGEANVPFLTVSGSEFVELFVGVGASRVRSLFEEARKNSPCIIFIDEIDAVGGTRGKGLFRSHDEREQTLNALLVEMDGFDQRSGIMVMAATNRPDILDSALTRPGRFDRQVYVPQPDLKGREEILKIYVKRIPVGADVDLNSVAKDTTGMTGADLENVVNEAALLAARKTKKFVDQSDLLEAVDKVSMGPARKSLKLSENEKKTVAYHEAGHALIATMWPFADPVHKITIIPRGPMLGFVKPAKKDQYLPTKEKLLAEVAVLCAGRAAEELVMKSVTVGAASDFARATEILRQMVCNWSMGKAGLPVYVQRSDNWSNSVILDVSDATKEALEREIKETLHGIYDEVKAKLEKEKDKLTALAERLLVKETLNAEEVVSILDSAS